VSIFDEYLEIRTLMQGYKKKRGDKLVYDYKRACENEPLLKESRFNNKLGRIELAKVIHRVSRDIKRGYIRIIEPKNHPKGFVGAKKIFGNIKGKRGYNNLVKEITNLILSGEDLKSHSRRLQRDYNEKKEIIEGSKETEGLWDWVEKDLASLYEKMSPEEIKQYKAWLLS